MNSGVDIKLLSKHRGAIMGMAIIMITHDRYFLDSVSNRIVEIDKGQIYSYSTNYSGFLELKAQREEMAEAVEFVEKYFCSRITPLWEEDA